MSVKRIYYVKHAQARYAKSTKTNEDGSVATIPVMSKSGVQKTGRGGRPMTRRLTSTDKSQPLPNRKCSRCGDEIKPGDPYLYWEPYFRSTTTIIRCMKTTCFPRPSERESSAMSSVLAAQESAQDTLSSLSPADADESTFDELRDQVVEALDEVIEQYRDADEAFGGSGATQSAERAEELESSKAEIENVSFDSKPERDELDACDKAGGEGDDAHEEGNTEGCEACDEIYETAIQEWFDEQSSNLEEALGNIG